MAYARGIMIEPRIPRCDHPAPYSIDAMARHRLARCRDPRETSKSEHQSHTIGERINPSLLNVRVVTYWSTRHQD